ENNKTELQWKAKVTDLSNTIRTLEAQVKDWNERYNTLQKEHTAVINEKETKSGKESEFKQKIQALMDKNGVLTADVETLKAEREAMLEENKELKKNIVEVEKAKVTFVDQDEDVRKVLQITDELMEHLPDAIVEKFVQSPSFAIFEKVFKKYNIE
ncbi:MAG: hypothetical protein ACMXYK_02805, partial [Candidatus Woesearchaeota archaeon]